LKDADIQTKTLPHPFQATCAPILVSPVQGLNYLEVKIGPRQSHMGSSLRIVWFLGL